MDLKRSDFSKEKQTVAFTHWAVEAVPNGGVSLRLTGLPLPGLG